MHSDLACIICMYVCKFVQEQLSDNDSRSLTYVRTMYIAMGRNPHLHSTYIVLHLDTYQDDDTDDCGEAPLCCTTISIDDIGA